MENKEEPLRLHRQWRGKLETVPKMRIATREDLALATAAPFWAWATSGRSPPCPSWRASARCSRRSEG